MEKKSKNTKSYTEQLEELIHAENLSSYLNLYRHLKDLKEKFKKSGDEKQLIKILSAAAGNKKIIESVIVGWSDSASCYAYVARQYLYGQGKPEDYAFNFLIFALIYDLEKYTRRPKYKLVENFLAENNIYPADAAASMDYDRLRIRFKRLDFDDMASKLLFLDLAYFSTLNLETEEWGNEKNSLLAACLVSPGIYPGFITDAIKNLEVINSA